LIDWRNKPGLLRNAWFHRGLASLVLLLLVLAACSDQPASIPTDSATTILADTNQPEQPAATPSATNEKPATEQLAEFTPANLETVTLTHTNTVAAIQTTPTPDLRLDPDDWQSWPVVPERVSDRLIEIYRQGLANQNNPTAFGKVGDCQNVPNAFLGVYDRPGQYWFDEDFTFLEETIQIFSGSFQRESQAVRGGFNVASVLSPLWADRQHCLKGETPLACEFRLWKPSIVIISMETWFEGRTPETYDKYLRQIVDEVLAHSAVPILATKADNTEGDHSINRVIAQVAYDYDLPLWNFWLAVQPLDDHGIDWERDSDGFHITVDAWNKRSFTALRALDAVWKLLNQEPVLSEAKEQAVQEAAPEPVEASPTPSPTPEALPSMITPYPASRADAGWFENGQVLLSLGALVEGKPQASGLLLLELLGEDAAPAIVRLTGPGFRLESLAPSGMQVLLSQVNRLYAASLDGSMVRLISENFLPVAGTGAAWLAKTSGAEQIAFLGPGPVISIIGIAQAEAQVITGSTDRPYELVPTYRQDALAWIEAITSLRSVQALPCVQDTANDCEPGLRWWSGDPGAADPGLPIWEQVQQAVFSPDGLRYAFTVPGEGKGYDLYLARLDDGRPRLIRKSNGYFEHLSWSPDGETLLAIETRQSKYSGRILERKYWLFNAERLTNTLLGLKSEAATHAAWSGDGEFILFLGIEEQDGTESLRLQGLEVARRRIIYDQSINIPWDQGYMFLERVAPIQ
jgi:hypothetical protein